MKFLMNVKITEKRLNEVIFTYLPKDVRKCPWSKKTKRIDVFKFSLDSISQMQKLFDKMYFNIIVEGEYENIFGDIEKFIYEKFDNSKIILNNMRCENKSDWNKFFETYEFKDNDIVFCLANDDHIFLDNNLETIAQVEQLISIDPNPMSHASFSHFPECMRAYDPKNSFLTDKNFFYKENTHDFSFGIQILKFHRIKKVLFEINYPNDVMLARFDELRDYIENQKYTEFLGNWYSPLKELFRHYDGYGHVMYSNNYNPCLEIPNGFFNSDIKIKYGFKNRFESFLNINPVAPLLYACSEQGSDVRYFIDTDNNLYDLPLVYKNKISSIEHAKDLNYTLLKNKRNKYYLKSTRQKIGQFDNGIYIPEKWIESNYI